MALALTATPIHLKRWRARFCGSSGVCFGSWVCFGSCACFGSGSGIAVVLLDLVPAEILDSVAFGRACDLFFWVLRMVLSCDAMERRSMDAQGAISNGLLDCAVPRLQGMPRGSLQLANRNVRNKKGPRQKLPYVRYLYVPLWSGSEYGY